MSEVRVRYDDAGPLLIPPSMEAGLILYMTSFCAAMREHDTEHADCWTWGRCYIGDLALRDPMFAFGGDRDVPNDGHGAFAVVQRETESNGGKDTR